MARPRTFDESIALEQAVGLFQEKGYEGTSLPDLVNHLGVCRQSLYNAFGDKRRLYLAALERYGTREVDSKLTHLHSEGSPLENLRTLVRGWAGLATQCPAAGCLTVTAIVESGADADALAIVDAQVNRLEQGFRKALEKAKKSGEIKKSASPTRLARVLICTVYGFGVLSRLPDSGPRIGDAVGIMLDLLDTAAIEA